MMQTIPPTIDARDLEKLHEVLLSVGQRIEALPHDARADEVELLDEVDRSLRRLIMLCTF